MLDGDNGATNRQRLLSGSMVKKTFRLQSADQKCIDDRWARGRISQSCFRFDEACAPVPIRFSCIN